MPQTTTPQTDEEAPNDDSAPPTPGAGTNQSPTIEEREAGVRAMLLGFYFVGAIIYSASGTWSA